MAVGEHSCLDFVPDAPGARPLVPFVIMGTFSEHFEVDSQVDFHPRTNGASCVRFVVDKETGQRFVAKTVKRGPASKREVEAHSKCAQGGEHNILPLFEVFCEELTPGHNMRPELTNRGEQSFQPVPVRILVTQCMGPTLRHFLNHRDRLRICTDMITAVRRVHACGYVHGDLKPDNFVVDEATGRVYLIDFGCAQPIGTTLKNTRGTLPLGTSPYLPPEVLAAAQAGQAIHVGTSTDMWAVGVIILEMLLGHLPFPADGRHNASLHEILQAQNDHALWQHYAEQVKRVAPELCAVLLGCMHQDPRMRTLAE
jgi:serine/threonine protein kinase